MSEELFERMRVAAMMGTYIIMDNELELFKITLRDCTLAGKISEKNKHALKEYLTRWGGVVNSALANLDAAYKDLEGTSNA